MHVVSLIVFCSDTATHEVLLPISVDFLLTL